MFVQIMEGHVGDAAAFRRRGETWQSEVRPGAIGFLGNTAGLTPDGTAFAIVRFESEASARANSDRAEQGAWWSETQKIFDGPVTFSESSDVELLMSGGSDSAGFVQVMKGSGDRALVAEMDALFEQHAPTWRPDVMGGLRAWLTATDYVEVIYFTSEADARRNESQPPPAALAARMGDYEALTAGTQFFDLADPIFVS